MQNVLSNWDNVGSFAQFLGNTGDIAREIHPVFSAGQAAYNLYQSLRHGTDYRPYRDRYVVRPSWGHYNTKYGYKKRKYSGPGYRSKYYRLKQKYNYKPYQAANRAYFRKQHYTRYQ